MEFSSPLRRVINVIFYAGRFYISSHKIATRWCCVYRAWVKSPPGSRKAQPPSGYAYKKALQEEGKEPRQRRGLTVGW